MFLMGTLIMLVMNIIGFMRLLESGVSELIVTSMVQTIGWLLLFLSSFGGKMSEFKTYK